MSAEERRIMSQPIEECIVERRLGKNLTFVFKKIINNLISEGAAYEPLALLFLSRVIARLCFSLRNGWQE
jgi:hypothetical protein